MCIFYRGKQREELGRINENESVCRLQLTVKWAHAHPSYQSTKKNGVENVKSAPSFAWEHI